MSSSCWWSCHCFVSLGITSDTSSVLTTATSSGFPSHSRSDALHPLRRAGTSTPATGSTAIVDLRPSSSYGRCRSQIVAHAQPRGKLAAPREETMQWKRFRPSPSMVVASLALAVALGGTGYAAVVLPANSVGTAQLKNGAVVGAKVKNGSLSASSFRPGALPSGPAGPAGVAGPAGPAGPGGA